MHLMMPSSTSAFRAAYQRGQLQPSVGAIALLRMNLSLPPWWRSSFKSTAAELTPMLEAPRTGDDAKDVTPGKRTVIIEQDPLYASYVAWGKGLKDGAAK